MFPKDLHCKIKASKVVAVLIIDNTEHAVPIAQALIRGGIRVMELTLRTPAALPALKAIKQEVPEMLAGIGTILTTEQVDQVIESGAAFGVAPGMNPKIVKYAQERKLPFGPGIMSPSDIEAAIELGCRTIKYFPAETSGGIKHLTGIAAPYKHLGLDFIPLGGLNANNMADYLRSPLISAIGGSWIAKQDVINAEDWNTVEANAREAREIADSI